MDTIVVPLSRIRHDLIESYSKLVHYVATELAVPPTSVGVRLNGHYGMVSIALNGDDDLTYQCEQVEEFTGPWMPGINVPEIEEWQQTGNELSIDAEGQTGQISDTICPYEIIFQFIVEVSKEFFGTLPANGWRPCRVVFQEHPVIMKGEFWICSGAPRLPDPLPERVDPLIVRGFDHGEPQGLKVFRLRGSQRKYGRLYVQAEQCPVFDGFPVAERWDSGAAVCTIAQAKRRGTLAACDRAEGVFALNCEGGGFASIREWLRNDAEFLSVREEAHRWELVHILKRESVINVSENTFNYVTSSRDKPWEILRHEFQRDAIETMASRLFKLAEIPTKGPFFVERQDQASFRKLCEEAGARGIEMELVWCEDLDFLFESLTTLGTLAGARLQRLLGTSDPSPGSIECLDRSQVRLWTLFRNAKKQEDLRGSEGYLTTALPRALRSLRHMEATGSGKLAIYGPTC